MIRVTSMLLAVVATGCALQDAGVFAPSTETARDALIACGIETPLPTCLDPASADALPAWERFNVSSDQLRCIEGLECGARDLDDPERAANTRTLVFACLDVEADEPLPTGDEAEACVGVCQTNLDFFICNDTALDDLAGDLDDFEACVDRCR